MKRTKKTKGLVDAIILNKDHVDFEYKHFSDCEEVATCSEDHEDFYNEIRSCEALVNGETVDGVPIIESLLIKIEVGYPKGDLEFFHYDTELITIDSSCLDVHSDGYITQNGYKIEVDSILYEDCKYFATLIVKN